MTTVSVFGGTGFLGRRLVRRLAAEGATVRVAVRHPERARRTWAQLAWTGSRSSAPTCATKPRSPPPSPGPTPSSTQSPPMSRRAA